MTSCILSIIDALIDYYKNAKKYDCIVVLKMINKDIYDKIDTIWFKYITLNLLTGSNEYLYNIFTLRGDIYIKVSTAFDYLLERGNFNELLKNNERVKKFKYRYTFYLISNTVIHFKNLEEIYFVNFPYLKDNYDLGSANNIKRLSFKACSNIFDMEPYQSLEYLKLNNCNFRKYLKDIDFSCQTLKHLILKNVVCFDDVNKLENLETLEICGNNFIKNIDGLINLQTLIIKDDFHILRDINKCVNLKTLIFKNNKNPKLDYSKINPKVIFL